MPRSEAALSKQVVQRDRFRIICEADAQDMGLLLAHMTRMGVSHIGFELVTDVRTFGVNTPRKVYDQSAEQTVLAFIKDNPTFAVKELTRVFREMGRTNGAAYAAVHKLVNLKVLVKLGGGNYQRADVKALNAPKGKSK